MVAGLEVAGVGGAGIGTAVERQGCFGEVVAGYDVDGSFRCLAAVSDSHDGG